MANGKQFVEELIEVFKSQPSLWQSKSDIYKNRVEKLKSWNILLEKYKEVEREATIDCVKKKINCLRITYRRELLKIVKSERSGAGADDIYTPSLWYFNQLDFLRDQEIQDESLSTLNCLEGSKMEKPTKRKRGNELEEDFLKKAAEYLDEGNSSTQKDDAQLFADGWAAMYRKIDQNQQMFAKRIIDEALMQGKMGLLTFSSFISSGEQRGQQYVPFRPTYFQTPSPNDIQNSSSTGSSYSTTTIPQLSPYATFTPSPVAIDPTTTQNIQILSHEVLSEATSIQQLFNDPNYK